MFEVVKMFNVRVTKPLPLDELMPGIRRFCRQRLSFGLLQVRPGFFEIWREPLEDENVMSIDRTYYRGIIRTNPPAMEEFYEIYKAGKPVKCRLIFTKPDLTESMQIKMRKN